MAPRHKSTPSPSNSMQLVCYNGDRRLSAAAPFSAASSRFKLPRGWGVREVLRPDGSRSDTYYYEPETGKQFRSTREVQRYLNGERHPCRSSRRSNNNSGCGKVLLYGEMNSEPRRMVVSGGKLLMLDNKPSPKQLAIIASGKAALMAPDILPDGWIVEEVPRKQNSSWIDRYYYEPGTGLKFRSLVAVERYLAELEENVSLSQALEEIKENKPLSRVFKLDNCLKNSSLRKKNTSKENTQDTSFTDPPTKVNWILASPRGDTWNPFISEDTSVPDSIKKQWNDRLTAFMNNSVSNCEKLDA